MLRIEDTDEDVDFLPRRPPEDRRYEDRGVSGAGLADSRLPDPELWVVTRGLGSMSAVGERAGSVWGECGLVALNLLLESGLLPFKVFGLCPSLALELGERPLFEVSLIQFRRDKRWFMKGCFLRRCLDTYPLG